MKTNEVIISLRQQIISNNTGEVLEILKQDPEGLCYKEIYSELNRNQNMQFYSPDGNNCLLDAISSGRYKIASLLIDDAKQKLNEQDFLNFISYQYNHPVTTYCTNTALTLAAKHEQFPLVEKLLNLGANPNGIDQHGFTVSTVLCMQLGLVDSKNQEIFDNIQLLIQKGADLNQKDKFNLCPYNYIGYDINPEKVPQFRLLTSVSYLEKGKKYTVAEIMDFLWGENRNEPLVDIEEARKELLSNIGMISGVGEHCSDAAIFDSLIWAKKHDNGDEHKYEITDQIEKYYEISDPQNHLRPNFYKKSLCKGNFFRSDEGKEMAKSLIDKMIFNPAYERVDEVKVDGVEIDINTNTIPKILCFDYESLPVSENLKQNVDLIVCDVVNSKMELAITFSDSDQIVNLNEEELIAQFRPIIGADQGSEI